MTNSASTCKCDLGFVAAAQGLEAKMQPPCCDFIPMDSAEGICAFCEHAQACHAAASEPMVSISLEAARIISDVLCNVGLTDFEESALEELDAAIASTQPQGDSEGGK